MTRNEVLAIIKKAKEEGWEELDLSERRLKELPEEIGRLENLRILKLGFNHRTDQNNLLEILPNTLGQMTNLQYLDLGNNKLGTLPESLGQLTNLQHINLSGNDLRFGTLTRIKKIFGRRKAHFLTQLTNLKHLDLSYNNLGVLPEWLGQLTNLQHLDLSYTNFGTFPESLSQLTNLKHLDLGGNNLGMLPEWLVQLTNLQHLDLSYINLRTLPEWLSQLTNLKHLSLGGNKLGTLPEGLGQLTNIENLDLSGNNLGMLPDWLVKLANLKHLTLSRNKLETLPDWVDQLTNLQSIALSGNKLRTLPEGIGQLTNLQHFDLYGNKLVILPEWIASLPLLQSLYIFNNPITKPSIEVLGSGLNFGEPADMEAIRRYFQQLREEGEETFYEAKLLIIGEGGAGKSSLARKLRDPEAPLDIGGGSTEGVEVMEWSFDLPEGYPQKKYRVHIWDFGGQEVYFATHQFFLTKRSVYVLVADTRKQHTDFYEWLRMQEAFGSDSPVILLKNRNRGKDSRFHIDNLPQLQERFANLRENVIELDLNEVPKDAFWPALLQELKERFLNLEHIGKPTPKTWVKVRELFSDDIRDVISRDHFLDLCYMQGVKRERDALQISDYLHHLGDILHFQDDPVLDEIVILNPTWGLDAVYRILDNDKVVDSQGQFSRRDLRQLWHEEHYKNYQYELLRLMENFQLCYPLPTQPDIYIAPQLLRSEVPKYTWEHDNNLQLRYKYPVFMPHGILSRAIVKLHKRIEEQRLVWRAGVILKGLYARAEVLELRGENEIHIRISGKNKRDFLMEIVRGLEELHQGFPKLKYEKLIPCNCATCYPLGEPNFYPFDHLRERLARGRRSIECYKSYDQVNIFGLLDDGYESLRQLDRQGRMTVYGDVVYGGKQVVDINDLKDSAVSFGDEGSASVNN